MGGSSSEDWAQKLKEGEGACKEGRHDRYIEGRASLNRGEERVDGRLDLSVPTK